MASFLPLRLLSHVNGKFFITYPASSRVEYFDIISYTWGETIAPYRCDIDGVDWDLIISQGKLEDIKNFMITAEVQHLWVDCVCINQGDPQEQSIEIFRMHEYYKNARMCHILIAMPEVWKPQEIVDNLKFLDHVLSHMGGAALASEAVGLTENVIRRLSTWATEEWTFPINRLTVKSAAIDMGVLNCYSTCISQVRSLFDNVYFTRVWTFQEMILGKNVTMWGIDSERVSQIGQLHTWMDLATDSKDKAWKLQGWIANPKVHTTALVDAILRIIREDDMLLDDLQMQVRGINSARADIINGGPYWWYENYKGISNIFSAVSITPRECSQKADLFRGLLGIFNGLFTPEEIEREISGNDIDKISFTFFKQLSTKTGYAWTKLAISSGERAQWDWIPVVKTHNKVTTTDCFAGVFNLGRMKPKGQTKTEAITGLIGAPKKYMKISLSQGKSDFKFIFRGCNGGKNVNTGVFKSEQIPTYDQPRNIVKDETGRILVQCATILGSIIDPGHDLVQYRNRLLHRLRPNWNTTDPSAKPTNWTYRCVSGSFWENPHPQYLRTHNMSMNYNMVDITDCDSRLENESTKCISCEVRVNCGCTIIAPFSLIFEAIMAVHGSSLGNIGGEQDPYGRIVLRDGLGLVQVGDVGSSFSLVAFGGDTGFHKSYSSSCRSTKVNKPVIPKLAYPRGRALVRDEFTHEITDMLRDYGYVETGGCGNLLICRNNPIDQYKVIGVCVDGLIDHKDANHSVTIR